MKSCAKQIKIGKKNTSYVEPRRVQSGRKGGECGMVIGRVGMARSWVSLKVHRTGTRIDPLRFQERLKA